jgi:hypothetical protein
MPATSKAQARFMNAVVHNPGFAESAGVPQSVGKEFSVSGGRYKDLPERKEGSVAKKKSWLKGDKGKKTLDKKLSEKKPKTDSDRMKSRYGSR